MKKIVAIMAVSVMLLVSCGQIKDFVSSGLKKDGEGSGTIGSNFATPAAEKTFWKKWSLGIGAGLLLVIGSIICLIDQCFCGETPKAPLPQNNPQPGVDNPGVVVGAAAAGGNAGH
jgi:hypothetical protein